MYCSHTGESEGKREDALSHIHAQGAAASSHLISDDDDSSLSHGFDSVNISYSNIPV